MPESGYNIICGLYFPCCYNWYHLWVAFLITDLNTEFSNFLPLAIHSFSFLCLESPSIIIVLWPIPTLPEVALIESLSLSGTVSFTAHSLLYCTLFPKLVPFAFVGNHISLLIWEFVNLPPFLYFRNFSVTIIYHAAKSSVIFAFCKEIRKFSMGFTMVVYEKIIGSINK